jgi:hypothetical protein
MRLPARLQSALDWSKPRAKGWLTTAFVLSFACSQFAYSIVMLDPNDQKWFWISVLATLALACCAWRVYRGREARLDSLDWLMAAFALYALASLAWTPDRLAGLQFLGKFAAAAAIFVYLKDHGDEALFRRLFAWTTVGAGVALFLAYTQPGIWGGFHNQNFITEYLLLAMPFCVGYIAFTPSRAQRTAAWLIVLGISWYLVVDNSSRLEFAIAPLVAACMIGYITWRRWGWWPVVLGGIAVALILGSAAFLYWDAFPYSERGLRASFMPRVLLVLNTLSLWLDAPLLGNGAGSFSYLFPAHQEDHLRKLGLEIALFDGTRLVAGAAHNEYVQVLAEFGLAGAAIVTAFVWRAIRIARSGPPFGPLQYAAVAAIFVWAANAALEFPLQNPSTLVLALASVAILVANPYRKQADEQRFTLEPGFAAVSASALLVAAIAVQILGDRLTQASKYSALSSYLMNQGDPRGAYLALREAYELNPWDYSTRVTLFLGAVILMDTESWRAPNMGERLRRQPFLSAGMNRLYDIARSAGPCAALLTSRLYYLVRSGNYPDHQAEITDSLSFLRQNAGRIRDIWMMDAVFGLLNGNPSQVAAARNAAAHLGMAKSQLDGMMTMESAARRGREHLRQNPPENFELALPSAARNIQKRLDPGN